MQKLIKKDGYKCNKCGHEWLPRSEMTPAVCPNKKCHSVKWNR